MMSETIDITPDMMHKYYDNIDEDDKKKYSSNDGYNFKHFGKNERNMMICLVFIGAPLVIYLTNLISHKIIYV